MVYVGSAIRHADEEITMHVFKPGPKARAIRYDETVRARGVQFGLAVAELREAEPRERVLVENLGGATISVRTSQQGGEAKRERAAQEDTCLDFHALALFLRL